MILHLIARAIRVCRKHKMGVIWSVRGIIKERSKQCSIILTTVGGKKNHPSIFSHSSTQGYRKAGTNPGCNGAKGWVHRGQAAETQRNTLMLTFALIANFRITNEKNMHVFGLLESLESSFKDTGKICKLHIEEPQPASELKPRRSLL